MAIQKPTDRENAVQALVNLHGYGISTAGSYRNYFEQNGQRYSHVIDPSTGRPINHRLVSATVIAPTALEADGWDTGLMVLGTEKALKLAEEKGLAVYLISKTDDGFSAVMTPQFNKKARRAMAGLVACARRRCADHLVSAMMPRVRPATAAAPPAIAPAVSQLS